MYLGDVIENIEIVDNVWWKGTCKGRRGLFPSNFVEKMETPESRIKRHQEGMSEMSLYCLINMR